MEQFKTQVSSIEAAIEAAFDKKRSQFANKLNEIKVRIAEIEKDLKLFIV